MRREPAAPWSIKKYMKFGGHLEARGRLKSKILIFDYVRLS